MDGRPHVPPAAVAGDNRILDRPLARVPWQHDRAVPDVELGRVRGIGHFNSPVLGPGGGAAQVKAPAAFWQLDQFGALQRFGLEVLLGDDRERGAEVNAVGRECDPHRVAAAAAHWPTQPVSEVDAPIGGYRRRGARPVTGTQARWLNRDDRIVRTGEQHAIITTNHVGIIDNAATRRSQPGEEWQAGIRRGREKDMVRSPRITRAARHNQGEPAALRSPRRDLT